MWKIVPRDEKFFDQIEQLSHLAKSSAQLMNDLVGRFPTVDGLPDQIGKAKVEAAQVMETPWDVWTTPSSHLSTAKTSCNSSPTSMT